MGLKWNGEVGPSTIIGLLGSLSILVTVGVVWGSTTGKIDAAALEAKEAKAAAVEVNKSSEKREVRISAQAERLGKIETAITFIVPALERIETKLTAPPK